ncbi:MAG: SPFH domain-containing protein [Myxococcota bacterium]
MVIAVTIAVFAVTVLLAFIAVWSVMVIASPDEIVVISGQRRRMADGTEVGYRVLRGGRAIRVPLLEQVHRMSLSPIPVSVSVNNLMLQGGKPAPVVLAVTVRVAPEMPLLRDAIERFLDRDPEQIAQVATQTLEGVVRSVGARFTPDEVVLDRDRFGLHVQEEAEQELRRLGLEVESVRVQRFRVEASTYRG